MFISCVVIVNCVGVFRLDCYMALSVPYAIKVCDIFSILKPFPYYYYYYYGRAIIPNV